jgi:hypothetical protein
VKFIRFQLLVLGILTCASLTQAQVWVKQSTTAQTSPHARAAAAITYSPVLQGVLLFGGEDGNTSYRDTWLWTDHWTKLSPATSPLGRSGANMVYDATNGNIVLFGGRNNARRVDFNDTWTFDGTNWTRQFPANSPPPRSLDQPAMTFDAAHGNVIFFGGSSLAGGYFGDTWTWDGTDWTQQFPANSPSTRRAALAYDPGTSSVILFGGDFQQQTFFNETWSWDGVNWTQLFPATSPSQRSLVQLAFDPSLNAMVLFGGLSSRLGSLADTWVYDGTTWTELPLMPRPQNRYAAPVAYDAATQSLLMFSGYGVGGHTPRRDTWLLTP